MRRQISDAVWIADEMECFHGVRDDWAVVHACKSPCHREAVDYHGSLESDHSNYLVYRQGWHLYLNMIDLPLPLFEPALLREFLRFAGEAMEDGRELLIHCNQGGSRAPSLGLLYMAKLSKEIGSGSYEGARAGYRVIDPHYLPGEGIEQYLSRAWGEFEPA